LKNSRTCVKCGSKRVVQLAENGSIEIGLGMLDRTYAEPYVCCDCGYMEMWAPKHRLEKIYDKYGWTQKQ